MSAVPEAYAELVCESSPGHQESGGSHRHPQLPTEPMIDPPFSRRGNCIIAKKLNVTTGLYDLYVNDADPIIEITAEFIDQAMYRPTEELWMEFHNELTCFEAHEHSNGDCFRLLSVLHIKGVNREVLYRIGEHVPERNTFVGRWPD